MMRRQYEQILADYLHGRSENQLYLAQQLGKWFLTQDVAPEEIIDFHVQALEKITDVPEPVKESFHLLTEVMMEYGISYREHKNLQNKQQQLESEIDVAVAMQKTMLPAMLPKISGVDIGAISVPSKKMNGDYYNIMKRCDVTLSVAIADIVGKGIPAALCMSMITFAMDVEMTLFPPQMLHHLNIVVERNIDPSMFVTMIYGLYDVNTHMFRYAVAGHEPGFLYRAKEKQFVEVGGLGLVLGVSQEARYPEQTITLEVDDTLILVTDGVTERKVGQHFLQRDDLMRYIKAELDNPAQVIVENVYRNLLYLSHFELPDDYTMIVIRRTNEEAIADECNHQNETRSR